MSGFPQALALSVPLTVGLEVLCALLWGVRRKKDVALVALVNLLTNPPVVLCYWLCALYTAWPMAWVTLALEAAAVGVEWACYRRYGEDIAHRFWFALAANAVSYGTGVCLNLFM